MQSSLIWVYTVGLDLSARKLRIIRVGVNIQKLIVKPFSCLIQYISPESNKSYKRKIQFSSDFFFYTHKLPYQYSEI